MKNIFSKLTVAAALAMSLAAGAGDIYEILPCDATGATLSGPVTSVANPVGGGEMCYFKVRLMKPAASTPTQWQLVALNGLDKSEAGFYVYVSGELRKATYQGVQLDASTSLRDFVFGFETKNGDFALPVVLATASGERADTASDEYLSYKLLNAGSWGFYLDGDTTTAAAELMFKTTVDYNVQKPEDGARIMDQTLAKAGFYVKAIDFDSNYYDEDELADPRVWRSIHQNGTTCVDMSLPSVTVGGSGATSAVSVWVWTEDPAVAEIWESGTETVTGLKADHVTPYTTKALKLTLLPGETTKSFRIKGKGAVGATTTVYMADTKTNIFDKAGLLLPNSVTRTVAVGEPEKPNLQIGFGNDLQESCTITADSDYKTYKVELMTVLSEAYTDATQPIKVKLAATYADGSGALDLSADDNVVFSATGKGAGWSQPVDTVTIDAGGTTGRFYVYVRGASAATENGIVLTATIDGTGSDYYDVAGATAELTLNRTAPDISAMAGLEFAGAFTGEAFAFENFAVVDTYANLQKGGTTGYTVSYKRTYSAGGGDGTYQTATFKTGLDGTTSGDPLKITFARAGDTTVEMFVTAPDGTKSAVVTFTVKDVQQSPRVNATVTSGLSSEGYAEEGATLKIAIDLGEAENSTAAPLYAYLYPADDETAQNVQTCDALAANGASGVPIAVDKTEGLRTATLVLKDGSTIGTLMTFNVFLSTEKTLAGDPDDATYPGTGYAPYTGYAPGSLMLTAVNVEPTVQYVQMNGADVVETSGEEFSTTTSQGIECKFAAYSNEPSETDLEALDPTDAEGAFYTRYTFYDGSAAPKTFVVRGNPNAMAGGVLSQTQSFTFQTAGRNRVVVQQMDKDMKDYGEKFTVYVQVNATPGVEIASGRDDGMSAYPETDVGPTAGALSVRLTAACDTELKVGLLVERAKTTDTFALPTLNLDTEVVDHDDNPATPDIELYVLKFAAGYLTAQQNVYFTFLDGTTAAYKNGVKITPVILTAGTSTYGITYKELYKNLQPFAVYPENVDPEILVPSEANESITNQASIGVQYTRPWTVSDIEGDFVSTAAKVELTVEGQTTTIAAGTATDESAITTGGAFAFTFTSTGAKTVTLTVTDKDGAQTTRNLYFMIDPAKNVYVYPHGGNNSALSTLSSVYVNADGLGSGYVWREGVTAAAQDEKHTDRHIHSFDKATTTASFVALGDTDKFLGNGATTGLPLLDSFLYGWIINVRDEIGSYTGTFMGFNPSHGKFSTYAAAFADAQSFVREIALPGKDDFDDTSNAYADRYLEAVFSREWRATDNLGDINQDGVPDLYANSKYSLVEVDGAGTEVKTKVDTLNDDADFYPLDSHLADASLVPGALSTWSTTDVGQPFTTFLEIRGFHPGLNYGMFKADAKEAADGWISDLDLSAAELQALNEAAVAAGWPFQNGGTAFDLSDPDDQKDAKDFIDSTWANYNVGDASTWGWTCENRTDPTNEDTDGDTMADGYEYYFWYAATIGFKGDGTRLTGKRFSLVPDEFETGTVISSEDIAAVYNPNVKGDWTKQDTDNDGLYDYEEILIGTNPVNWDTDGDGLSDLYEVIYNINPISADGEAVNGAMNLDRDYMARTYIGRASALGGEPSPTYFYIYTATNGTLWAFNNYQILDPAEASTSVSTSAFQVVRFNGGFIPATEMSTPANLSRRRTVEIDNGIDYIRTVVGLYHHQVYRYYGFDPRTGWFRSDSGYLSPSGRWKKSGYAGVAVMTEKYTALDEFRLLEYRYRMGLRDLADDLSKLAAEKTTIAAIVAGGTTNPNAAFEEKQWGDYAVKTYAQELHGADTDGDGVPDGWELYIGVSPNASWTLASSAPGHDPLYRDGIVYPDGTSRLPLATEDTKEGTYDGDGLNTLVAEYAGTDSCGAFADCTTIYANHPSQSTGCMYRWYNKFFPTDPWNGDTDGDGVLDGDEGNKWSSAWIFNRWGQNGLKKAFHYTIYGTPHDNGKTCIPGGGMNPCTIDTDEDGLPDAWEMQYAGILIHGSEVAAGVFPAGVPDPDVYDDIRAALSARRTTMAAIDEQENEDTSDDDEEGEGDTLETEEDDTGNAGAYFVIMGMDPTVGDACTPMKTGTSDLDWDGDGLQNWQEYMVQSMRHFRYDDCRTPLMGFDIPVYDATAGKVVRGTWRGENGYLKMSFTELFNEGQIETLGNELGYANFAAYAKENPDMLRKLGYFADPPKAWDYAKLKLKFKYMLPPQLEYEETLEAGQRTQTWTDEFGAEYELYDLVGASGTVITNDYLALDEVSGTYSSTHVYVDVDYDLQTAVYYAQCVHPVHGSEGFWEVKPQLVSMTSGTITNVCHASGYVSTDPRLWDTDNDGMDDFWELYHGLNPILGHHGQLSNESTGLLRAGGTVSDVIYEAYLHGSWDVQLDSYGIPHTPLKYPSTWQNAWIGWDNVLEPPFDPIQYPWMMGTYDCDADGDGLRNIDEAILANVTTPGTKHTDPSSLWMTDISSPLVSIQSTNIVSIVFTNKFGMVVNDGTTGLPKMVTATVTNEPVLVATSPSYVKLYYTNELPVPDFLKWHSAGTTYSFAFEQNEGYDSDGDFKSDGRECVKSVEAVSDPIDFSDPYRRQSMYFGGSGKPGIAINYAATIRNSFGQDLFKQFTVEAWVRPDAITTEDQCVVSRAANYSGWDLLHTNAVIRTNFALGIDTNGQAFAEFENDTKYTARIEGGDVVPREWTHLAATFDGSRLLLYVNGIKKGDMETGLIPANGVQSTTQDPQYNSYLGFPYSTYYVGPCATIVGGRAIGRGAFSADLAAEAANWGEIAGSFFGGSVDEVRIWDGARSPDEISQAYQTRLSAADIKSRRDTLYSQYRQGYRRNDGTERDVLDPELIQHYSFCTMPGALEPEYVQKIPAGFETNALATVVSPADGSVLADAVAVGWWNGLLTNAVLNGQAVYTNKWTVPWIQNTVNHLPRLSGILADSVYWSELYAGYTPALFQNLEKFQIANAMTPYSLESNVYGDTYTLLKLRRLAGMSEDNADLLARFYYDIRHEFNGTEDLVPVGHAFAKRLDVSWDEKGAEDAWSITTSGAGELDGDGDDDGLPSWYSGDYESYWRALVEGLLPPGGTPDPKYRSTVDTNGDGLPDWWSQLYGLVGGAADDDDKDGLSNYTEYLLGEVFDIRDEANNRVKFDPTRSHSTSAFDSDYFYRLGQVYVGEIFTDHDLMEDAWESEQGADYASRRLWDADGDKDEDGWSAFAECRYNQVVASLVAKNKSHLLNGAEVPDFPTPVVHATFRYNGTQLGESATNALASLVVKAYGRTTKQAFGPISDATWRLSTGSTSSRELLLGTWSDRTVYGTLTPGNIDPTSFNISFASFASNDTYVWYFYDENGNRVGLRSGSYKDYLAYLEAYGAYGTTYWGATGARNGQVELVAADSNWAEFGRENAIMVTSDSTTENGYICFDGERIGTINLVTGEYVLNLAPFERSALSGTNGTIAVQNSIVKLTYAATVPTLQANKMTLHLGRPDSGALDEGLHDFAVFYDLDGNGEYTPGEPFGYAADVDVGWFNAGVEIELTDFSPVTARIDLWNGTDDRGVPLADTVTHQLADSTVASNIATYVDNPAIDDAARYVRYRVVRWTVDGLPCVDNGFVARVVVDGRINRDDAVGLTECAVLGAGLDLDWENFPDEVVNSRPARQLNLPVSEVTYMVVIGDVDDPVVTAARTASPVPAYEHAIVRRFDKTRAQAVAVDPEILLNTARPTFRWKIEGEDERVKEFGSSYTAFALRILDASSNTVYQTGPRRMPPADQNGVYSFSPDVYAGCDLLTLSNYTWQVAALNAKFHDYAKDESYWSEPSGIYVNMTESSDEVGKIRVAVKYFGPTLAFSNAVVVAEAFASPDFTGEPLARAVVADRVSVTNQAAHVENARLIGVPKGTCYVRAYLDSSYAHGTKNAIDGWESWGYVCPRENAANEWTFAPTAIMIGDVQGEGALFDCYIEDRDTNRNGLPDAWEMVVNYDSVSGLSSLDRLTDHISTNVSGIVVNTNLSESLTVAAGGGSFGSGLAAQALAAVNNAGIALLALDVTADGSYSASLATGTMDGSSVSGEDVTITNITYAGGVLRIGATLTATAQSATTNESGEQTSSGKIWLRTAAAASDTTEVSGVVYYKTDLADATQVWADTGVRATITIRKDDTTTASATVDLGDFLDAQGHPEKCFFKIVLP